MSNGVALKARAIEPCVDPLNAHSQDAFHRLFIADFTRQNWDRLACLNPGLGFRYDRGMVLSASLAAMPGKYFGNGEGSESGPFVSRITVGALPNGGAMIEYEATSREQGVQHLEQTMLVAGPDGSDRLYVAHSESPFVTVMVETAPGSGRFEQPEPIGPYLMAIVIEIPRTWRAHLRLVVGPRRSRHG